MIGLCVLAGGLVGSNPFRHIARTKGCSRHKEHNATSAHVTKEAKVKGRRGQARDETPMLPATGLELQMV